LKVSRSVNATDGKGFRVVEAVRAFAKDVEKEINFAGGEAFKVMR